MRTLILAVALVAVVVVVPAFAIEEGTVNVPATLATQKIIGTISEVKVDSVVLADKKIIAIDPVKTLIKVDGKTAKKADLKQGMTIIAECEVALEKKLAKSIEAKSAVVAPKAPAAPAPKPAVPAKAPAVEKKI